MEFDESRAYSAINADKVKVGSKGFFADNLGCLRDLVFNSSKYKPRPLMGIAKQSKMARFRDSNAMPYNLFYLVEEPHKESKEGELCTYRELSMWLAQANGEWKYSEGILSNNCLQYDSGLENDTVNSNTRNHMLVRKWGDREWHSPTREYMGIK